MEGVRGFPRMFGAIASIAIAASLLAVGNLPAHAVTAAVNYYGGPVESSSIDYIVEWGSSVNAASVTSIGAMFPVLNNSAYLVGLSEYTTAGVTPVSGTGTVQGISPFTSYAAADLINPSQCATATTCTVTDAQVQAELQTQIGAGHLPAPSAHTNFFVIFPPHVTISAFGSPYNGATGGCSYNNTGGTPTTPLIYAVLPDLSAVTPGMGCVIHSNYLDDVTAYASGQLVNMITDPLVGLDPSNTVPQAPVAWYSPSSGEIGNICYLNDVPIYGVMVMKWYSKKQANCVTSGPGPAVSWSWTIPAFGDQVLGSTSSATVTIKNTGSNTLVFNDISIVGAGFTITPTAGTCSIYASGIDYLTPGSTCPIKVSFTPTTPGYRFGNVLTSDNAQDLGGSFTNPQQIATSGTGVAELAVLPAVANAAYGGYTTAVEMQNTGAANGDVLIHYFDSSGALVGTGDDITGLPPNGTATIRQDNGHSFAANGAGSAIVYSSQPVASFVNEFAPGNVGDATSYSGVQVPSGWEPRSTRRPSSTTPTAATQPASACSTRAPLRPT